MVKVRIGLGQVEVSRPIKRILVHNESKVQLETHLEFDEESGVAHVYVRDKAQRIVTG